MKNIYYEKINLIESMIKESQGVFKLSGGYFIIWGISIPLATLFQTILMSLNLNRFVWISWAVVMGVSAFFSYRLGSRESVGHKSSVMELYKILGIALLIFYIIVCLALFSGVIPRYITFSVMSLLLASAYLIWGSIAKAKSMIAACFVYYICSVLFIILKDERLVSSIMGFSPLLLAIIPGVELSKKNE